MRMRRDLQFPQDPQALQESIAFIDSGGLQKPDFRTISDFRQHHLAEFQELFNQVVDFCQRLGMLSLGHLAIDGSKFKANAADSRTVTVPKTCPEGHPGTVASSRSGRPTGR